MRWPVGPPKWTQSGEEPDYRFSLANERTFLAWVRTALALMAAAVAVVQLVPELRLEGARKPMGLLLAAVALIIAGTAYAKWAANERAMRHRLPLPRTPLLQLLGGVLTVVGLIVIIVVAAN
jgi:putative membrane protein